MNIHLYETSKCRKYGTIPDYNCFYTSIQEITDKYLLLRAYCLRSTDDDFERRNESQIVEKRLTFSERDQLNTTGEHLCEWSAPTDTIEQYRINNTSRPNEIFYNCSSPVWFGSYCQYALNSSGSFSVIVMKRFLSRLYRSN